MPDRELRGVYPILATPFDEEGRLDLTSQARLVHYLIDQGAHGLGLFGNASEGYALTGEERRQLLKLIVTETAGRVPLVVSSGHTGTDAAVELSREAEALGADALMVLPPYFLKTDGDGLMFYFDAISRAVNIPIMVQDAPLMTQVAMPPALLARMTREIEHVTCAKVEAPPTAPKVTDVLNLTDGKLTVFGGLNGQFFIEEVDRGALGVMPGSDMTAMYVSVWDALRSGERTKAWEIFTRALPLIRFELQPGMGVSAMKHNLVAEGILRSALVRHPTASLKAESLKELAFLRDFVREGAAARA
jgi:2-keto-3-deoxy-L-arabinonate dehydratase